MRIVLQVQPVLWRRVTWILLPVVALVASGAASFAIHTASAQSSPGSASVYLVPAQPAHPERQPFVSSQWQANGVRLVHSFADLRAAVTPATQAVMFDGEVFAQVDRDWLRAQFAQRRTIVGINVDMKELYQVVGDPRRPMVQNGQLIPRFTWVDWPATEPRFALAVKGDHCTKSTQDSLSSTGIETVMLHLQLAAQCASM